MINQLINCNIDDTSIISIPSSLDEITSTTIQRVFSSPEVKEVLTTPELLLHIFSFLPVPALINNCRLVSRFWCRIVNIPPKIIAHINSLKKTKIYILAKTTIYDHSTSVSLVGAYTNETRATNQLIRNYIDGVISYAPQYSPDGYSSDGFDGSVGFVGGDEVRSTGKRNRLGREGLVWELKSITLDTKVEVVEEKDYDDEDYEYLWE
ncbi:12011_t:CDS:2 [Entrophospora sp. SA101]|nr:12011_t:CDS:2 [Entrophospora sp. SA101]